MNPPSPVPESSCTTPNPSSVTMSRTPSALRSATARVLVGPMKKRLGPGKPPCPSLRRTSSSRSVPSRMSSAPSPLRSANSNTWARRVAHCSDCDASSQRQPASGGPASTGPASGWPASARPASATPASTEASTRPESTTSFPASAPASSGCGTALQPTVTTTPITAPTQRIVMRQGTTRSAATDPRSEHAADFGVRRDDGLHSLQQRVALGANLGRLRSQRAVVPERPPLHPQHHRGVLGREPGALLLELLKDRAVTRAPVLPVGRATGDAFDVRAQETTARRGAVLREENRQLRARVVAGLPRARLRAVGGGVGRRGVATGTSG